MGSFLNWLEGKRVTLYTQSSSKGATVGDDDSVMDSEPVMLDLADIINYERASKMDNPKNRENMELLVQAIKDGKKSYMLGGIERRIDPILVRVVDNLRGVSNPRFVGGKMVGGGVPNSRYKYQVIDGHHRYWAYKASGKDKIPAIVVSPENISWEKHYEGH